MAIYFSGLFFAVVTLFFHYGLDPLHNGMPEIQCYKQTIKNNPAILHRIKCPIKENE